MTAVHPPISRRRSPEHDDVLSQGVVRSPPETSGDPTVPTGSRDLRLDLFRGLALIFIFIDHIPENVLSYFTLQAVQFYDAAEVFIFISGYTAALVYGRTLALFGVFYATAQILRRVWQLYVAHIFLFMIFIAEVSYTVTTFNNPMYNDEMRVADFLWEPHIAIVKALFLEFQPTFLDILPLYILLLVIFPVILVGLRLQPLLVLIPSFLVYGFVQMTGASVPAYPEGHVWYFNPLAWQFLFTAGAALGLGLPPFQPRPRPAGALLYAAIAITALGLVIKLSWTIHGVWDSFPGLLLKELWPVNKSNLSPIRLLPFFSTVAVIAAFVRPGSAFLRSPAAKPVILCGQQSLEIFCLGILLSALGHFVLSEYDSGIVIQLAVNVGGVLLLFLTAKMIDWYRAMGRSPQPGSRALTIWRRGDIEP
ncbi:MAG: OpgC domain-containing protein [Mycobacterium sp.]|nr:OpgC domain-containing protein [Mycobacterium sp.]